MGSKTRVVVVDVQARVRFDDRWVVLLCQVAPSTRLLLDPALSGRIPIAFDVFVFPGIVRRVLALPIIPFDLRNS